MQVYVGHMYKMTSPPSSKDTTSCDSFTEITKTDRLALAAVAPSRVGHYEVSWGAQSLFRGDVNVLQLDCGIQLHAHKHQ